MRIAICDDNAEYIVSFEEYISLLKIPNLQYDTFLSGEELVAAHKAEHSGYDAIFLDMEMKGLNGIDTANQIRAWDKHVVIVFVTNHTKYMQQSFECQPFRFLIKPMSFDQFKTVFSEVSKKIGQERTTFVFSEKRKTIRLFCEDILYFESQGHWTILHHKDGTYKICKPISYIYEEIDKTLFSKTHKSFIVNLGHIKEIHERDMILYNGDVSVPISRTYKKDLMSDFMNFKERKYLI